MRFLLIPLILSLLLPGGPVMSQEWTEFGNGDSQRAPDQSFVRVRLDDGTETWIPLEQEQVVDFQTLASDFEDVVASNEVIVGWELINVYGHLYDPPDPVEYDLPIEIAPQLQSYETGVGSPIGLGDISCVNTVCNVARTGTVLDGMYSINEDYLRRAEVAWRSCTQALSPAYCMVEATLASCARLETEQRHWCHSILIQRAAALLRPAYTGNVP